MSYNTQRLEEPRDHFDELYKPRGWMEPHPTPRGEVKDWRGALGPVVGVVPASGVYNSSNIPFSIYQPLGDFVFIFVYYLVFCDQSDDLVESILVYWRILDLNKCGFHPKMIYIEMGVY